MLDTVRSWARLRAGRRPSPTGRTEGEGAAGARVLCIASGKGGTGKSVLATNVAALRAARGERVCLLDFDAGLANDHLLLGLAPRYDLGHLLTGEARLEDALVEGPHGLHLLSGGVGRHALANPTRRELDRLFRVLEPLEQSFDLLVIDHGAGIGYATIAHLAAASTLLLVSNPEVTALSDGYALYKRATMVNPQVRVGLVINRSIDEETALASWERFRAAAQRFLGHAPELVGWIPQDHAVTRSVQERVPLTTLDPHCVVATSMRAIATWGAIDVARGTRPFYEKARRALR